MSRTMASRQSLYIRLGPSTATNQFTYRFNDQLNGSKWWVKWVQVIGATFPADALYYISGQNAQNNNQFGNQNVSDGTIENRCLVVPIQGANSLFAYDLPRLCIDLTNGGSRLNRNETEWIFTVRTLAGALPAFTSITIVLEDTLS